MAPPIRPLSRRVKFPGGSGHELSGIVDSPPEGVPLQCRAVFSHCFTCSKDLKAIVRISRALAVEGVEVLRYDMTGLGGSEGIFSKTNFTTNVADLRAAHRFAEETMGPVDALIGHSFGGAASMSVAGEDTPENLRCIVLLASPADTVHLPVMLLKMNPAIEIDGQGKVEIGGFEHTITAEMLADFRSHDLPKSIGRIQCPTLILHSPTDETVRFDQAIRIETLIRTSDSPASASLVSLDGADHLLTDPEDLKWVASLMAGFLIRRSLPERPIAVQSAV